MGLFYWIRPRMGGEERSPSMERLGKTWNPSLPEPRKERDDWTFLGYSMTPRTGKPYQDVKRSFHTALRKAGIKDFKFHDLRHCFASHLVMAGIDLTTVKELLGHKTLTMTLRYSHLSPSHKVRAVDVLDNALNNKSVDQISTAQKLHSLDG